MLKRLEIGTSIPWEEGEEMDFADFDFLIFDLQICSCAIVFLDCLVIGGK